MLVRPYVLVTEIMSKSYVQCRILNDLYARVV